MSDLNKGGFPVVEGVYLVKDPTALSKDLQEIDVYDYKMKGLSCFCHDFGSAGTGIDDKHDCHVSVQNTGLIFVKRVGDLK